MKLNLASTFSLFVLSLSIQGLQAQSLNVKEKNGTLTSTSLPSISKLTFDQGQLIIGKNSGANEKYNLNSIQYINFADIQKTSGYLSIKSENPRLSLYPNPVIDELTVQLNSIQSETFTIEIYTIDGKLKLSKSLNNSQTSEFKVNLSSLPLGTYICILSSGTLSLTSKFQKL
ncbi:T9SS type A sorting domain-containing protein [Parabacteroides sp. FAFU027]|uniref:T9SS type A sorting domain-containing protein n=1 Tax=Parabacteroides sp. FAFU027 TaxID=2922715 RepID=UPI001FAF2BBC|nr:T9SS type A sorting domain-containing protein [Parabacteroides sp. FAFU027]